MSIAYGQLIKHYSGLENMACHLMGVGDWNDGMNLVGPKGRGESVWLGWFICDVLKRFEDICQTRHDSGKAEEYQCSS